MPGIRVPVGNKGKKTLIMVSNIGYVEEMIKRAKNNSVIFLRTQKPVLPSEIEEAEEQKRAKMENPDIFVEIPSCQEKIYTSATVDEIIDAIESASATGRIIEVMGS